jgi:hypothetical protein
MNNAQHGVRNMAADAKRLSDSFSIKLYIFEYATVILLPPHRKHFTVVSN